MLSKLKYVVNTHMCAILLILSCNLLSLSDFGECTFRKKVIHRYSWWVLGQEGDCERFGSGQN